MPNDNLLYVRQKFIELSGRFDLATTVTDTHDTDNGADFFIVSGQRMLDRFYKTPKDEAVFYREISAGDFYVTFDSCRAILEVWASNSEERFKLTKVSAADLRAYYSGLVSVTDQGEPAYYTPTLLRSVEDSDRGSLGDFFDALEDEFPNSYNGIMVMPPVDEAYVIEIYGKFYSETLENNADISFWTSEHPMVLVWAALYQLEVSYRNTEGAKDWLNSIKLEIENIDKDTVEEDVAEVREMDG